MGKEIKITISGEALYLLDALCDRAHLSVRNRRGILVQQLIFKEVQKIKVNERPVYVEVEKNE